MNLGEFLENFSDNNVIRLVYKSKTGYSTVLKNWNQVCMDWEVNKGIGKFKDYVNSEVIGIAQISMRNPYADAINIIIKMDKELEEDTKRAPYFELVDKKAESNNTIDLDAYAKGVEDGVIWQAERMYSEEDLKEALYYALSVNKTDGIIITTDSQIVRDAIKFIKQDKI